MRSILAVSLCAASGVILLVGAEPSTAQTTEVKFNRDIRPILSNNCFHCHGPDAGHREADLRLDEAEAAFEDRGGYVAIAPGRLAESEAWLRIVSDDTDLVMPPPDAHKELTADEKDTIRRWIEQGARYEGHWAYLPPVQAPLPNVTDASWATHPIDRLVAHRLQQEGLQPSGQASKEVLLRRVTFDLTGLPPTLSEIDAFLADDSAQAYERVVDRLLDSPRFGERMAVHWLDAARYGDTSVFHADGPRDMWVWRDWVVEAFNRNLSYDQFTIHQIAGDQLPDATWRELVATGFQRNNATTDEGGAIAEEFRVEYAVDRVKTTSMVWLGLSMECAQCHEHKYDPISQEEYYRFFAFFNQAADPGMQTRNGNQSPIVEVPDLQDQAQIPTVEAELTAVRLRLENLDREAQGDYERWLEEASTQLESKPMPSGAVAHLPLDEVIDDALLDRVAAENQGRLQGDAKLEAGKFVQAVRTGAHGYASFDTTGDFERDQAFSYSVWFYSDTAVQGSPLARMDVGNGHRGYDLLLSPKEIEVHLIHRWPENAIKVEAATDLPPKQWHHVCVTYDGSSQASGVNVYLNGQAVTHSVAADQLTESIRTDTPFLLGRRSQGAEFDGKVDDVRLFDQALTADQVAELAKLDAITELLKVVAAERTDQQEQQLRMHFLSTVHTPYRETLAAQTQLEARLAELKQPLSTVMVMKDVGEPRMTYVLKRGQYDSPDQERPVEPGTPEFLPPLSIDGNASRLDLARWIVARDNPLTARVAVNRFWQLLFGTGIVKTVEEFGSQGEWPSHPELLDWLAVDFMENGWDIKRLLKQIVMSQTYRQSSSVTPELAQRDPENRLLARGPRFRLSAEMVRDQALACSGLLVDQRGGPSVKPYQPPGLWSEVSLNPGVTFTQDSGPNQYRRSLYTYWKRSSPPPMMLIFDAPSREKCSVRRSNTNTPLQALVLLNDPQFLEASRAMAQQLLETPELTDSQRLIDGFRRVTSRQPDDRVLQILIDQLELQRHRYREDTEAATQLLAHGDSPRNESLDVSEHAAWMIICSILLNLDETVTRG